MPVTVYTADATQTLTARTVAQRGQGLTVAFDAVGTGAMASSVGTGNLTKTWTHTAAGGIDNIVFVIAGGYDYNGGNPVTHFTRTCTYGGVSMTSLAVKSHPTYSYLWMEVFYLVNPPTGAKTVSHAVNGSKSGFSSCANSVSYTGASVATPVGFSGDGGYPSMTMSSAAGDLVLTATFDTASGGGGTTNQTTHSSQLTVSFGPEMVIGDAPGAASVTTTDTQGYGSWVGLGIDLKRYLISLPIWTADAPLTITADRPANRQGVPLTADVSLPVSPTAWGDSALDIASGPVWVSYVGRTPDSDATLVPKSYADARTAATVVTTDYIAAQIAEQAQYLLSSQSYVDIQDGLRAHKTEVLLADTAYVPTSVRGTALGVASLDSNGSLTAAQVPSSGVLIDRVMRSYSASGAGILLAPGASQTVLTATLREFKLATVSIPDPGYPWWPLPFGMVAGCSTGDPPASRQSGDGVYLMLAVMSPVGVSETIYGAGIGTASIYATSYPVVPYASVGQVPVPITGAVELGLYASCLKGSSYVVYGTGLSFSVLCVPAI